MTPAEENTTEKTFKQNPLPTFIGVIGGCFVFIFISIFFGFHWLTIPLTIACGIKFKQGAEKRITHSHGESLSTEEYNKKYGNYGRTFATSENGHPIPSTSMSHPFFDEHNRDSAASVYWRYPSDR